MVCNQILAKADRRESETRERLVFIPTAGTQVYPSTPHETRHLGPPGQSAGVPRFCTLSPKNFALVNQFFAFLRVM